MGIDHHPRALLLALLLLWGFSSAWARPSPRYTQGDEGHVHLSSLSEKITRERIQSRGFPKPFLVLRATVENRLPLDLASVWVVLRYHQSGQPTQEREVSSSLSVPAHGQKEVAHVHFLLPSEQPVTDVSAELVGYRLMADPARTPELAQVLLRLASSKGLVDLAVAAELLPRLGPDAQRLREELRPWVAGGTARVHQEFGEGVAPLYALRLLGRVGTGEDVPVLLGVLSSGATYLPSLGWLGVMRERQPDHPMTRLLAPGAELREVVGAAIRDMRPELSAPALVALAYAPGPLRREAGALLRGWTREGLVAALRGPQATQSLEVLCTSRAPDAVPLVLELGMAGVTGVDLEACLSAMPEKETVGELVRVLGDALGPLEGTVFDLLAARGRAVHARLQVEARELGLPEAPDPGTLARAVHERRLSRKQEALREMLAQVEGLSRAGRFEEALALLDQARGQARGHEQRAQVWVRHARVAHAAATATCQDILGSVLTRLQALHAGHEPPADLDLELVELARAVATRCHLAVGDGHLQRIEALVGEASRPTLAEVYLASAEEQRAPWAQALLARRALALDAGNAAAPRLLEHLGELERRRLLLRNGGVLLGVLGVVVLVILRRRRATAG